jgi:replicative DNA helicase
MSDLGNIDAGAMCIDSPYKDGIAERKVLCKLANEPNLIFDIDGLIIKEGDFAYDIAKCIYAAVKSIATQDKNLQYTDPIDSSLLELTISQIYGKYYELHLPAIKSAIAKIYAEVCPKERDFKAFVKIILINSVKRKSIKKLEEITYNISSMDDPTKIATHIERSTIDFTNNLFNNEDIEILGQNFEEWLLEKHKQVKEGKVFIGIKAGFPNYEEAIGGGFRPGSVNVIAARAKRGKSFLALAMGNNIAEQTNYPVLYLDTELDNHEIQPIRLAAQLSQIPMYNFEHGQIFNSEEAVQKTKAAAQRMLNKPIYYVDIKGSTLDYQVSIIRRFFAKIVGKNSEGKFNPALVILDYLKLMHPSDKAADKEYEALGYRLTALKNLMQEYRNPMLCIAQQNREGIDKQSEDTVAGSDRIIWFCDNFTIFYRLSEEDIAARAAQNQGAIRPSNCGLKVVACRNGPGTQGRKFIGIYADIHDPKLKLNEVCGKFEERSVEVAIIGGK